MTEDRGVIPRSTDLFGPDHAEREQALAEARAWVAARRRWQRRFDVVALLLAALGVGGAIAAWRGVAMWQGVPGWAWLLAVWAPWLLRALHRALVALSGRSGRSARRSARPAPSRRRP